MNVQFLLCAQSISVDQQTSRLSVFNVLEQINVPAFPIFIPELSLVALVRKEDGDDAEENECSLTISKGEKELTLAHAVFHFSTWPLARLIFNFSGLGIDSPGDIDFNLVLPKGIGYKLTIPVTHIPATVNSRMPV